VSRGPSRTVAVRAPTPGRLRQRTRPHVGWCQAGRL